MKISISKELFINQTPFIDVRAPVEFLEGNLPGSICLPLLNDEERVLVGTCYKTKGQSEAIELGHQLVSGDIKSQRLSLWKNFIEKNPSAIVYCFRGGLRSQTVQKWLRDEVQINVQIIEGGYKQSRDFLLKKLPECIHENSFYVLSGKTGSAKSYWLRKWQKHYPSIDLEHLAHHRGSAFGGLSIPQPSQVQFENQLAVEFLRLKSTKQILIEDESRLIGKNVIPVALFEKMRQSPVIWLESSLEDRVAHIKKEYVDEPFQTGIKHHELQKSLINSLTGINKKLGGLRFAEIGKNIESAFSSDDYVNNEEHFEWIRKLLEYYYDPLYTYSLERRMPDIVFKGTATEIQQWIISETCRSQNKT